MFQHSRRRTSIFYFNTLIQLVNIFQRYQEMNRNICKLVTEGIGNIFQFKNINFILNDDGIR